MSIADPEFGGDTHPTGVCTSCGHKIGLYSDCWIRTCLCGRCKSRVNGDVVNFCDKYKNWSNHCHEVASSAAYILQSESSDAEELRNILSKLKFTPKKPENLGKNAVATYGVLTYLLEKIKIRCPQQYDDAVVMFSAFINPEFSHKDIPPVYSAILQFCILDDTKKITVTYDQEVLERCYVFISQQE